ncbi:hypothetical protein AB0K24_26240, partial [Streptomyces mirabilis]
MGLLEDKVVLGNGGGQGVGAGIVRAAAGEGATVGIGSHHTHGGPPRPAPYSAAKAALASRTCERHPPLGPDRLRQPGPSRPRAEGARIYMLRWTAAQESVLTPSTEPEGQPSATAEPETA